MRMEKKIVRDWSDLPSEILELFCKRLSVPDQIRFGSVCKSWFSPAFKRTDLYKPPPDTPWLITTNSDSKNKYLLLSPSDNRQYHTQKPYQRLYQNPPYISGSFKGWLVIQSKREIHIGNLFSKVLVKLPLLSTMPDFISSKGPNVVIGMETPRAFAISTCVHLNPTIIAVATLGGDLALCKIGDTAWKGHHQDINKQEAYANLTFFNAKLYAINKQFQKLDIFEVDDDLKLLLVARITINNTHSTTPSTVPSQVYLVECGGNLLVVKRYFDKSNSCKPTIGFEILKVEEDGCNPPRLGKVDKLKEQVMLLGNTNSECVAAKDCGRFTASHIYFTGMSSYGISSDVGVYSVEEKTLRRGLLPTKFFALHWVLPRFTVECNCALPKTNSV